MLIKNIRIGLTDFNSILTFTSLNSALVSCPEVRWRDGLRISQHSIVNFVGDLEVSCKRREAETVRWQRDELSV